MSIPVTPALLTDAESVDAIAEAEAGIAQCMADLFCNTLLPAITALTDLDEQIELTQKVLCSYTCKEKGMAAVMDSLANKILADKGLVPGGNGENSCSCG